MSIIQFERFRRIFHHSTYRVLLGHQERKILSSLHVNEVCQVLHVANKCSQKCKEKLKNCLISTMLVQNLYKQRVWVRGTRPEEEEIYQFNMVQVCSLLLASLLRAYLNRYFFNCVSLWFFISNITIKICIWWKLDQWESNIEYVIQFRILLLCL